MIDLAAEQKLLEILRNLRSEPGDSNSNPEYDRALVEVYKDFTGTSREYALKVVLDQPKYTTLTIVLAGEQYVTDDMPTLLPIDPADVRFWVATPGVSDEAINEGAEPDGWDDTLS